MEELKRLYNKFALGYLVFCFITVAIYGLLLFFDLFDAKLNGAAFLLMYLFFIIYMIAQKIGIVGLFIAVIFLPVSIINLIKGEGGRLKNSIILILLIANLAWCYFTWASINFNVYQF